MPTCRQHWAIIYWRGWVRRWRRPRDTYTKNTYNIKGNFINRRILSVLAIIRQIWTTLLLSWVHSFSQEYQVCLRVCNERIRSANLYVGFSRNGNPDTTHVYDRPDVLCRVFNQKQKELLKDIKERELLGKYKALLSVIEFQKRGAPHAHTLVG